MQRKHFRTIISLLVVGVLAAACGRQPAPDDALQRELELARSTGVDLLPRAGGQQIVSDIESAPKGTRTVAQKPQPSRAASRPSPPAAPRAERPRAPEPQPAAVEVSNESEAPQTGAGVPRPSPAPAVQPPPPGGYKTVREVLKNAPFPILP